MRDSEISDEVSFSLKNGIYLEDSQNQGITFEVDLEKDIKDLGVVENDQDYFDNNSILDCLNFEVAGGNNSSDSDGSDGDIEPFQKISRNMKPCSSDNGVMKRIKREGTGGLPPALARVTIHYNGYMEYNDMPFDSTRLRNDPHIFVLNHGVLPGINIAVSTMQKGEISEFILQPKYAYGTMGAPPRIPPNSPILYVIELLDFIEYEPVVEYQDMSPDERKLIPFTKLLAVLCIQKTIANVLFNQKSYGKALKNYKQILHLLLDHKVSNEELNEQQTLLLNLYCNMAQCHLHMKEYKQVISCGRKALEIDCKNLKALFRCGKAYRLTKEYSEAEHCLLKAQKIFPYNEEVEKELRELKKDQLKYEEKEKEFCSRIFKSLVSHRSTPVINLSVPDEFEVSVKSNLHAFVTSDVESLPFSPGFTESEIEAIKCISSGLGLKWRIPETGAVKLIVYKGKEFK